MSGCGRSATSQIDPKRTSSTPTARPIRSGSAQETRRTRNKLPTARVSETATRPQEKWCRPRTPACSIMRAYFDPPIWDVADREHHAQRGAVDCLRERASAVASADRDLILICWAVSGNGCRPLRKEQIIARPSRGDARRCRGRYGSGLCRDGDRRRGRARPARVRAHHGNLVGR